MPRLSIKEILHTEPVGTQQLVKGWVRSFRNNQFVAINDGSTINNLQAVITLNQFSDDLVRTIAVGAAISVDGKIVESMGKGQTIELQVSNLEVLGEADPEKYPLQPKKHSLEFLREIAHLRFRTNTFSAVFRVRHRVAWAIHEFFNNRGFFYIHSPIITGSDAEGAGEMFRVTALDPDNLPRAEDGSIDWKQDFFGKQTNLTVSGQLEAELAALALTKVYTFGPTFRAEYSHTTRHLAEFWMIEPEVAFIDLNDNMDLAEAMLRYILKDVLEHCDDDLAFLEMRLLDEEKQKPQHERSERPLREKLQFCLDSEFVRLSYTEAYEILRKSKPNKKGKFQFPVEAWGIDIQSEHERYLVEKHFKKPVILFNYPKAIKAFYMRVNEPDSEGRETVAAMDILFPGIGEIVGGSQREERYDVLLSRMKEMNIPSEEMEWFLETRKFGSCPHAGYGLGLERMIQFVTGMGNIRDVIPFPRYPGSCEF